MLSTMDINTVKTFLNICNKEIKKHNCYFVGYRSLNINGRKITAKQALIDIGIMSEKDLWNHILELEASDCIKIERDRDHFRDNNSEIFVFIKPINGKSVYIKITINNRGVICLSFHESYSGEKK